MTEKKGTKGLELWCRKITEGYPGVKIDNMTTSWRDGLGFCAIIHHFKPDLIDFSKLNKNDIYHNNELAFRVAERHFGIPALLEPEDMVEYTVPDRLSILTYLSQFYQAFAVHGSSSSSARVAAKRPVKTQDLETGSKPTSPTQATSPVVHKIRRDPCKSCGLPVFIAERLNVGKYVYHRTCFRCARCNSQLTLANYYETESDQFCCEVCPDEERTCKLNSPTFAMEKNVISRSLSDEEKTAHLKKFQGVGADMSECNYQLHSSSLSRNQSARASFIHSQIETSESESEEDVHDRPLVGKSSVLMDSENDVSFKDSSKISTLDVSDTTSSYTASVNVHKIVDNSIIVNREDVSDDFVKKSEDVITKDAHSPENNKRSIVRDRLGLFETLSNDSNMKKSDVHKKLLPKETSNDNVPHNNINEENQQSLTSNNGISDNRKDIFNKNDNISDDLSIEVNPSIVNVDNNAINIEVNDACTDFKHHESKDDSENIDCLVTEQDVAENTESLGNVQLQKSEIIINLDKPDRSEHFEQIQQPCDDNNEDDEIYPDQLNPFDESDDEKAIDEIADDDISNVTTTLTAQKTKTLNPFGDSEDDDDEEEESPARKMNTNPFEDDEDECVQEPPLPVRRKKAEHRSLEVTPTNNMGVASKKPMPTPRSSKRLDYLSEKMPESNYDQPTLVKTSATSSTSSLNSSSSHTIKKKKPAPKPPPVIKTEQHSEPNSMVSTDATSSLPPSPRTTPKIRKTKKAPPPPSVISTIPSQDYEPIVENEKTVKDEANRNKQTQHISEKDSFTPQDKSTHGKWKRRKCKAPPRPVPIRRVVKPLPMHEINAELDLIEVQQLGLEKQGVKLEQIIREKCEGSEGGNADDELPQDVDDMILQLFELVNEKNELFRRQAELMYLRRQQKLEEEQAEIEYQIRCLMMKPEVNITDSDKTKEEELISRLLEIVERRNEIVDCLEMDRLREVEEDNAISSQLNLYTSKREEQQTPAVVKKHKKFKKKYWKEKKASKGHKLDLDKDIDETETSPSPSKQKDKKKKFSIF